MAVISSLRWLVPFWTTQIIGSVLTREFSSRITIWPLDHLVRPVRVVLGDACASRLTEELVFVESRLKTKLCSQDEAEYVFATIEPRASQRRRHSFGCGCRKLLLPKVASIAVWW